VYCGKARACAKQAPFLLSHPSPVHHDNLPCRRLAAGCQLHKTVGFLVALHRLRPHSLFPRLPTSLKCVSHCAGLVCRSPVWNASRIASTLAPQTGKPPPPLTPPLRSPQTRLSLLLLPSLHRATGCLLCCRQCGAPPWYCFVRIALALAANNCCA
jgi:hypothetical protein